MLFLLCFWFQTAGEEGKLSDLRGQIASAAEQLKPPLLNSLAELLLEQNAAGSLEASVAAFRLAQDWRDPAEQARAKKNEGLAQKALGELDASRSALSDALLILNPEEQKAAVADCYATLGLISELQSEYEQAMEWHQKAIVLLEGTSGKEEGAIEAKALNGLGIVHFRLANREKALEYFDKALQVHRRHGNVKGVAAGLNNTGILYKNKGDYTEALRRYDEALALQHGQQNLKGMADVLSNMAIIFWLKKDLGSCREHHANALELYRKAGDRYGEALALGNLADALAELGEFAQALAHHRSAQVLAADLKSNEMSRNLAKSRAELYEKMGQHHQAFEEMQSALALTETFLQEKSQARLAEMEARFQARQQRQEIELLKKNEAINLLQSEARAAEIARLEQAGVQDARVRNSALAALGLFASLAALLYHRMRALSRANRIISAKNAQLQALDRIVRALNHSSDASIVWQAIAEHLMREIRGIESLAIWRFNNPTREFELTANHGPHAMLRPACLQIREAEWRFFSRGEEIRPGVYWAHAEGVQQGGDELILTIDYEQHKVGFMVLAGSREGRDLDDGELDALARFREYVITALARAQVLEQLNGEKARAESALRELQQLNAHLVELATHDPLTGLANRRMVLDTIGREMVRFERHGRPFSLLLLDVDHFKRLNDTFGHLCGDEVLKQLAAIFSRQTRKGDLVARWGGEEFLFFLPETDGAGAQLLAERVRSQVEQAVFSQKGERMPVTLTIGLTTFSGGKSVEQMIHACDEALYAGKASGRNQVRATA